MVGLVLVFGAGALAQERVDLTTPETKPSNTSYRPVRVVLDADLPAIEIWLKGDNGEVASCHYTGPTAQALLVALNKADLSTRSLNQRILDRVVADGCLVGTVAGSVP
jgi:hypothetical protein